MEPFIVIPDKPLLEELISLDVRHQVSLDSFRGSWSCVRIDESFSTIAHQHAIAVHGITDVSRVWVHKQRFDVCVAKYVWYLRTVSIWRRFVISPRVPCSRPSDVIQSSDYQWRYTVRVQYLYHYVVSNLTQSLARSMMRLMLCCVWCTLDTNVNIIIEHKRQEFVHPCHGGAQEHSQQSSSIVILRTALTEPYENCSFRRWFPWSLMSLVRSLSPTCQNYTLTCKASGL
jgi:hypothetical protein